jgi:hypothetical protein
MAFRGEGIRVEGYEWVFRTGLFERVVEGKEAGEVGSVRYESCPYCRVGQCGVSGVSGVSREAECAPFFASGVVLGLAMWSAVGVEGN